MPLRFLPGTCILCYTVALIETGRYPYENFAAATAQKVEALLQRMDMSNGMQAISAQHSGRVSVFDWYNVPAGMDKLQLHSTDICNS